MDTTIIILLIVVIGIIAYIRYASRPYRSDVTKTRDEHREF